MLTPSLLCSMNPYGDERMAGPSAGGSISPDHEKAVVEQAAVAYARLVKESPHPVSLPDFVAAFMQSHGQPQEDVQMPSSSSSNSASTVQPPQYFASSSIPVPDLFQPMRGAQLDHINNSADSNESMSWMDDMSNSLSMADTSASNTSIGTPNSSTTSWSRSHSKHASTSSSMSASADALAAYAGLGSPIKGQLTHQHQQQQLPLRRSLRGLPHRSQGPASPFGPDSTLFEDGVPLVLPGGVAPHGARTASSSIMGDLPNEWAAPFEPSRASPSASTTISEPLRSRSNTAASFGGRPRILSRHNSMQFAAASPSPGSSAASVGTPGSTAVVRLRAEFGDPTFDARVEESRQKRHRSEVKRRSDIIGSFERLKECIGADRIPGRMVKVQVLETACVRIQELEKENVSLDVQRRTLIDENTMLKVQVSMLAQQLHDALHHQDSAAAARAAAVGPSAVGPSERLFADTSNIVGGRH